MGSCWTRGSKLPTVSQWTWVVSFAEASRHAFRKGLGVWPLGLRCLLCSDMFLNSSFSLSSRLRDYCLVCN
jgi:hypothetical protein